MKEAKEEKRGEEKNKTKTSLHLFTTLSPHSVDPSTRNTMVLLAPSPGRYLLALLVLSVLVVLPLALAVTKLKSAPDRLRRRR